MSLAPREANPEDDERGPDNNRFRCRQPKKDLAGKSWSKAEAADLSLRV